MTAMPMLTQWFTDNITVLSTAQTLADSIRRIFADDSVSEIFAGENQLF